MKRTKRVTIKVWSEKTPEEKLTEAYGAIARLEATLKQGDNRFGEYGRNTYAALDRWNKIVAGIKAGNL